LIVIKLAPGREIRRVEWREGLRVKDVFDEAGWTYHSVHVFVNGIAAEGDKELKDGDELVLVPIAGGG
jgi:sulfur carrier protein ThiS